MLGGIFHKRKKSQELRTPSLQDLKKFRDVYAKYAELRQVETPPCFEKSIYKAIAGQKELHSVEFRQEDITDPQMLAMAEALLEMPLISSFDLRDNRITDDGAKGLLEVLRLQLIAAKTLPTIDPRTKQPLYPPLPEYTRYITNINLKGNEVSPSVLQEISQYIDFLRREDKRLEIRTALNRIDRNNDGTIDEEEFKGVLKLLTASTPTKKEIRAFMQQHTLSTDSTQNVINLENVLLAKCAVSPSRHSASPPWEALVQERHAILGAPRMTINLPESSPLKPLQNRRSLSSSSSGLSTGTVNSFRHSDIASDLTPPATPSSQIASVAPLENMMTKPQSASTVSAPAVPKNLLESTPFTKPPAIPTLPLASMVQTSVSPSPRSARSSMDDEGQKHLSLTRERVSSSIISALSSPHDSDISDSMSVVSSAFDGSVQRVMDTHEHSNGVNRKLQAALTANPPTLNLDLSREQFSVEDDENTNTDWLETRDDIENLSSGDAEDHKPPRFTQKLPKSVITSVSSANEQNGGKSLRFPGTEALRDLTMQSEISSANHEEKRSLHMNVASRHRFDDLSSLVYRGTEGRSRLHIPSHTETTDFPSNQPEEDEKVEEQVESLIFDLKKDGKERSVVKLIHSEFRNGLSVKDFPAELPFRNLLALLLPDNELSDLVLFSECRFPFALVLDLSRNMLTKLTNNDLLSFPRLEVLNLANNQLRTITGFSKIFKLRALDLSHNFIRSVKNVEHLALLEILQLANNNIATVHALRLLSLNKVLAHLNLDGNPVVETDERQKRKNIVHIRNLLPVLQSLGSISCAGFKDKKKVNSDVNSGKCLFESDMLPDYKSLWVSTACDELQILQDMTNHNSRQSQHEDDDAWENHSREEDGDTDRPKKPLTREQQRQRDELRSRFIGFRSRGKAIPSPPKVKMSVYSFGIPQASPGKKKKKLIPADPTFIRKQQRRASELSAPKHGTVDKNLMQLEKKRKSRVDFNGAMTVGERLQLARDMTQRRPTATLGLSARSKSILAKANSRKRASTATLVIVNEEEEIRPGEEPKLVSRPPSPQRPTPKKDAMVFRIDPADTPRSPKGVLSFRVDPYPAGLREPPRSPKLTESKVETGFLYDLAVSDFLNHAEEEFSTALTALNVLLSMSEKELGDRKKLVDYRASLDALDILNEHESHQLYTKTQGNPEHKPQTQCTEWFTKLGIVKKSMRQLLEKLELHAPGSGVIRAYCRYIRSNELRGIITTMLEEGNNHDNTSVEEEKLVKEDTFQKHELESSNDVTDDKSSQAVEFGSVASRIFAVATSLTVPEIDSIVENTASAENEVILPEEPHGFASDDNDLNFLESTDSVFDIKEIEDVNEDTPSVETIDDDINLNELQDEAVVEDPVLIAGVTDITMDSQTNDVPDLVNSIQSADDTQWTDDAVEEKDVSTRQEEHSESVEICENESFGEAVETNVLTQVDALASVDEDNDWLGSSSELQAETDEADSFTYEMDTVSEDEGDGETKQEVELKTVQDDDFTTDTPNEEGVDESANWSNKEVPTDECDDWPNTEIPTEEGVEASDGVFEGETFEKEEINDNVQEDHHEDTEADESETEAILIEAGDEDDEEAETFGDWEKGFDPSSNHYFWFNHNTGESSWTPPEGWPHEVDEPFSAEDQVNDGEEQQEQEYEEGAVDIEEYESNTAEEYEENGQYNEEAQNEGEGAVEGQYYEEGAVEGEYYDENPTESSEYENTPTEEEEAQEDGEEEQQYEATAESEWYDETAIESEDQTFEEQQLGEEESPRRSEVSDFEFDDTDLPI